jgi:hypothetical protein
MECIPLKQVGLVILDEAQSEVSAWLSNRRQFGDAARRERGKRLEAMFGLENNFDTGIW